MFLCVVLKLFSLSFVPHLTRNPGNATGMQYDRTIRLAIGMIMLSVHLSVGLSVGDAVHWLNDMSYRKVFK